MNKDYIFFCTYHDKNLITEYNLIETDNYKLYYTKDENENSLNKLQEFFCEFTTMFYVYKNKKYIDYNYIGCEHYSRTWVSERVKQNNNILFSNYAVNSNFIIGAFLYGGTLEYFLKTRWCGFLYDDLILFVKTNYKEDSNIYKIIITNIDEDYTWLANSNFFCKTNYFEEIISFLYNFTMYIDEKYKLNYDYNNYKKFIEEKWFPLKHLGTIDYDSEEWLFRNSQNKYRIFAYLYEQLIGYYFGFILKNENLTHIA